MIFNNVGFILNSITIALSSLFVVTEIKQTNLTHPLVKLQVALNIVASTIFICNNMNLKNLPILIYGVILLIGTIIVCNYGCVKIQNYIVPSDFASLPV